MYIVIIGCGRSGSYLANRLSKLRNDVVIIDKYEKSFRRLSTEFTGFKICGDGTEVEILKQAKCDKADVVVAATDSDNINSMISQISKTIYKVPKVLVEVIDPDKESIYQGLDIIPISPTDLLVKELEDSILDGEEK
ncbi:MAG: potassium channel family protein [Fusobacteriota bacterium]